MTIVLGVIVAFLIGSVPFGYVIGRFFYRTDIRSHGSGNIGAMNALRSLGKRGAIAVLLLDALKGFVPTLVAHLWLGAGHYAFGGYATWAVALVAAAAVLGHCFSPWLGWKGGKGVATAFGALFGIAWPVGLIALAVWLAVALLLRYSSVGSMLGGIAAAIAMWFVTGSGWLTGYGALAALLIIYTHRENLGRLRAGTESRIRLTRQR